MKEKASHRKNFTPLERRVLFVIAAVAFGSMAVLTTRAFTGPTNSGGVGAGAISSDAQNNIGVGTVNTSATTKLYVVASSTSNSHYAFRVVQPNTAEIFTVRNDGTVNVPGSFTTGSFTGTMSAANVSSGSFGQNTGGGNYTFPARLGINGATLSSWDASFPGVIEGTDTSIGFGTDTDFHIASNAYHNAGWKYRTTDLAANYYVYKGEHAWRIAGSGTAGNAITWIDAMKLTSAGNLGIGTISPGAPLEVERSQNAATAIQVDNPNAAGNVAYSALRFYQGPTLRAAINSVNDGFSSAEGGAGALSIWNNVDGNIVFGHTTGGRKMTIASNGNVGIGGNTPGSRLSIVGPVANGVYTVAIDSTAGGQAGSQHGIQITGAAGTQYLDAGATDIFDAAPYLRVSGGGVNGQYVGTFINGAAGTGYGIRASVTGSSGTSPIIMADNSGTPVFVATAAGNVGIGTASPSSTLTVAGVINNTVGGYRFPDGTTQTTAAGGASTISAANVSSGSFGQNTGGGSYVFPAGLTISGVGNPLAITAASTATKYGTIGNTGSTLYFGVEGSGGASLFVGGSPYATGLGNATAHSLQFATNNTVRATIDSAGRLGIGLTNPTYPLEVTAGASSKGLHVAAGSTASEAVLRIESYNSSALGLYQDGLANVGIGLGPSVKFHVGDTKAGAYIGQFTNSSATGNGLVVQGGSSSSQFALRAQTYNGSADLFAVRSDGNVGIGTANPQSKLSLNTSTASPGSMLEINNRGDLSVGSWSAIRFGLDGNSYPNQYAKGGLIYETSDGNNRGKLHLAVNTAASGANVALADARLTADGTTGNVGIGDTSPAALLSVGNGDLFQVNSQGYALLPAGTVGAPSMSFVGDPDTGLWSSGTNALSLSTAGVERVKVDANGFMQLTTGFVSGSVPFTTRTAAGGIISQARFGETTTGGVAPVYITNGANVGFNIYNDGSSLQRYGIGGFGATIGLVSLSGNIEISTAGSGSQGGVASMTPRVIIQNDGDMGLGVNPSYQLHLSTDSAGKPNGGSWTNSSDRRLKDNIRPFNDGLGILMKLEPKQWEFNGKANIEKGLHGIGFVAQDVEDVIPYAVGRYDAKLNPNDEETTELYSLNPSALDFITINAIKELNVKVDAQQQEIDELKAQIQEIKNGGGSGASVEESAKSGLLESIKDFFVSIIMLPQEALAAL